MPNDGEDKLVSRLFEYDTLGFCSALCDVDADFGCCCGRTPSGSLGYSRKRQCTTLTNPDGEYLARNAKLDAVAVSQSPKTVRARLEHPAPLRPVDCRELFFKNSQSTAKVRPIIVSSAT